MSQTPSASTRPARIECVVPILRVESLRASIDYYLNRLGFRIDWGADAASPAMASVSRDGFSLMLCQGGQGNPGTWVWVGVEDVVPLHEEFTASGARIVQPPTNYAWALEMKVIDPDGHVLRFGSDPIRGEPFND